MTTLLHKRLLHNALCSGCGRAAETTNHLFRECPVSISVWKELSFLELLHVSQMEFQQWLTWVFEQNTSSRCRIFCCALWAIWEERNKRVHKKANRTGKEIASFINNYISELKGIEEKVPKIVTGGRKWKHPPDKFVKINFDAAYDRNLR
ncbi:hypothetical protein GOBAR_AA37829 [Gossypium barbadense]|uniref:Reverse transcriptase zinc-binding domain-containing protein n=1 Tax=Gossypium barbadense TaxID=3634 RepID=A0A2P5VVQ3_GOSBA|nr:hypothetical protein GOBAR_AA37829 [Gossypium barbadense]